MFIQEARGSGTLAKMGELQKSFLDGDVFISCQEEIITDKNISDDDYNWLPTRDIGFKSIIKLEEKHLKK
jgi:hypothetical protein